MLAAASDLGHLFRTEHERLMRAMRRLVGSAVTAEDLVQDVFVGLLRGDAFMGAENKQAYLARCATNIALTDVCSGASTGYVYQSFDGPGDDVIGRDAANEANLQLFRIGLNYRF
ncbi:RNA polymerase sigma factor [Ancylobacter radicis]|uniref:RNA polymerase sigma factor n=1 Tax=Ancylobacter radicis TaxID=2836179 RepID=UPI00350FF8B7